jgi:hypothetical protein
MGEEHITICAITVYSIKRANVSCRTRRRRSPLPSLLKVTSLGLTPSPAFSCPGCLQSRL